MRHSIKCTSLFAQFFMDYSFQRRSTMIKAILADRFMKGLTAD